MTIFNHKTHPLSIKQMEQDVGLILNKIYSEMKNIAVKFHFANFSFPVLITDQEEQDQWWRIEQ